MARFKSREHLVSPPSSHEKKERFLECSIDQHEVSTDAHIGSLCTSFILMERSVMSS